MGFSRVYSRLTTFPARHPLLFGVSITAIKTGGVDILVQKYVEKADKLDVRRTCSFTAFGVLFLGMWQYFLFVKMMPRIVPGAFDFANKSIRDKLKDKAGLKGLFLQNFVENGINNPLLFFPCFYSVKSFVRNAGSDKSSQDIFNEAMVTYKKNCVEDVLAIWAVWIPAQFINFAFSPKWLRVPYVACVSALWTAFVSIKRGSHVDVEEVVDVEVVKDGNGLVDLEVVKGGNGR